ncbi:NAD(P)/FAD-dependent oxidoreductase [Dyella sp.]|jgi:thioredoxin reductase (NADPH)|uniref:NAD(P)/FAD-dependent oxidoreductase n=1 Tax=Dyella sp. TaxID=1869338 RepID=UPI002D76A48F|nr:NAD(P)/FAD-dependent oxidoreductase [Dyella sp.]HET6433119.1 NAD(P)/FAD-dependent oxidoreductase [Dyella sp.]
MAQQASAQADIPVLDCVVIGAGPAGLTAATYLARYRRRLLVLDAGASRARWIPASHNCPGFPMGVAGDRLLARYREQALRSGVVIQRARVEAVARADDAGPEQAFTIDGRTEGRAARWRARHVVLATGVVDRLPAMEHRDEAIAQGVLRLCAVCDAYEARDQRMAVLGKELEATLGHARFLRTFSRSVTALVTGGDAAVRVESVDEGISLRCGPVQLALVDGECAVRFADGSTCSYQTLYPVLGAVPQAGMVQALAPQADAQGALRVGDHMETSVPGLYAIGDLVSGLNQISVAVGHAALAATAIHRALPPRFA